MPELIGFSFENEQQRMTYLALVGKPITSVVLHSAGEGQLVFTFGDGTTLLVWDAAQNCCEHRYMTCDDRLEDFAGALLYGIEAREVTTRDDASEVHEVTVLRVHTSIGDFTVETHNEHNGYYGGFDLTCDVIRPPKPEASDA